MEAIKQVIFEQITFLANNGKVQEALENCKEALTNFPNDATLIANYSALLARDDQIDAAKQLLIEKIECINNQPIIYAHLIRILTHTKEWKLALKYLEEFEENCPGQNVESALSAEVRYLNAKYHHASIDYLKAFEQSGDKKYLINAAISQNYDAKKNVAIKLLESRYEQFKDDLQYNIILGKFYQESHREEDALAILQNARKIDPNNEYVLSNLTQLIVNDAQYDKAFELYKEFALRCPDSIKPFLGLSSLYRKIGNASKAMEIQNELLTRFPDSEVVLTNIGMLSGYTNDMSKEEVFLVHKKLALLLETAVKPMKKNNELVYDHKKLKVGFVSADFYQHAVSYFLKNVCENAPDEFEVYAYHNSTKSDFITAEYLKIFKNNWRSISGLSTQNACTTIMNDEIDILIDVSGYTAGNRLDLFQARAAALQVTWLGYGNTTGLETIDYRITDIICDPIGEEKFYTEDLLRLPERFLSFDCTFPNKELASNLKFESDNKIVFGCFNNTIKISDECINLWMSVLNSVPNSVFHVKNFGTSSHYFKERVLSFATQMGVDHERIVFIERTKTFFAHLKLYNDVHLSIDSFPYNGTTTTYESLAMGVPVLTMTGETHLSRVSSSILSYYGLNKLFVADNPNDICKLANYHANNLEQLSVIQERLLEEFSTKQKQHQIKFAEQFYGNLRDAYYKKKSEKT